MMRVSDIWKADDIKKYNNQKEVVTSNGKSYWVLARPMGFSCLCLKSRLKSAWDVFLGRADVVYWEE